MEPITLHAFDGKTGEHVRRLAACTALSWADSINAEGRLTASVAAAPGELDGALRAYKCVLAAVQGGSVLHAGYLTHASYEGGEWALDAGGALTVLYKRLVVSHALASSWRDGTVVVDEDNPSGDWALTWRARSYSDLVSLLIRETLKFGELPIVPAELEGGSHERTYNSYDLATVADRIRDIMQLEDGPEVRFDPVLSDGWRLAWRQRTAGEIVDSRHAWNAHAGWGVALGKVDVEGSYMCGECYATGGRDEDRLLVARRASSALADEGYPLLQAANVEHSSVSELPTLASYAAADVAAGRSCERTRLLHVTDPGIDVRVGDWADVRVGPGAGDVEQLKVVDVEGSVTAEGYSRSVQLRERSA